MHTQEDWSEDGLILDTQAFMNQAAVKHEKIKGDSEFHSSTKTIQEDVVTMLAPNHKRKSDSHTTTTTTSSKTPNTGKLPPFVKHFKTSNAADAKHYVIGDSKVWEDHTW